MNKSFSIKCYSHQLQYFFCQYYYISYNIVPFKLQHISILLTSVVSYDIYMYCSLLSKKSAHIQRAYILYQEYKSSKVIHKN